MIDLNDRSFHRIFDDITTEESVIHTACNTHIGQRLMTEGPKTRQVAAELLCNYAATRLASAPSLADCALWVWISSLSVPRDGRKQARTKIMKTTRMDEIDVGFTDKAPGNNMSRCQYVLAS